ncbi:MAG TPA: DUF2336 domain-containing protein [Kaistiaceae bacterium]|nr:DUF2336 domain-containing protein [Kaistiaceae bacterium]
MRTENTVEILTSGDHERMRALADDESCSGEALVVLSQSLSAEIRASVARNQATPGIADELLSKDEDVVVRAEVARKAARRAADPPERVSEKLRTAALQILTRLIADQEARVRQVIAEEVKASAHVPKEFVTRLARDESVDVSAPVLEYSPLLTDEDLISIITDYIHSPALKAVAKRRPVSPSVAEKLVDVLDIDAISELLRNPDAQIREAALERIIETAHLVEELHEPLVGRESLSARAIRRICAFVSDNLLKQLADRADLDEESRSIVAQNVIERLESENATISDEAAILSEIRDELMVRHKMGRLNDAYIAEAARNGKHTVVAVALDLLSGAGQIAVRRAIAKRDANGIVALCWKAGLTMPLARLLQEVVAHIPADRCLEPTSEGTYPVTPSTLEWNFAMLLQVDDDDAEAS